jgi:hypothetical protein
MGRLYSTNEEELIRLLVERTERKRSLGKPRRTWLDNTELDLLEIAWSDVDEIGLAQDRDKRRCGNDPSGSIKFWEVLVRMENWWSPEWCQRP